VQLSHEFTVPAGIEETWQAFNDIAGVAGCFPGATVSSVEGDAFRGSCKVKLGPIALVYNGSGEFVEKDEAARTMKIAAKGKDKRGNGTAGADVVATMAEQGGGTKVTVVTDLTITGKPAQFGRGVIQDVSDKLLGQFVECLEGRLQGAGGSPAGDEVADTRDGADVQDDRAAPGGATSPRAEPPVGGGVASADVPPPQPGKRTKKDDDALDLGATVIPVLLKSYGKQAAIGIVGLVVLVWIIRRVL